MIARTIAFNFANALAAGIGGIIVARELGPAGRGDYATLMSWLGVALILGELGQTSAVVYFASREQPRAPTVVATSARLMLRTGSVAAVMALVFAGSHSVGSQDFWNYLALALAMPVSFVAAPYVFALQAIRISTWNWIRSVQPMAWLIMLVTLSVIDDVTLTAALVILVLSSGLQGALAWLTCRGLGLTGGQPDRALSKAMVGYGLSNLSSILPASLTRQVDVIILGALTTSAQVGYYSVAMSFILLSTPVASAIGSALFPAQARSNARSIESLRRYLTWSIALTLGVATPLLALATWLLPLMYGADFSPAVSSVFALVPALIALVVNQVGGDLLRGQGHPARVARASWAALGSLVVLLLALVPQLGAVGACGAVSLAQCVGALVLLIQIRQVGKAVA